MMFPVTAPRPAARGGVDAVRAFARVIAQMDYVEADQLRHSTRALRRGRRAMTNSNAARSRPKA
jgi:hypothetical protein